MRSRKAFIIAYADSLPDDLTKSLVKLQCDKYAWIYHDKDTLPGGEMKKPHYHVYAEWENQKEFNVIAAALGTSENLIEKAKSPRGCIRYLVHIDDPEKYQYPLELVQAQNIDIRKFFVYEDESAKAAEVLQIVLDNRHSNSFAQIMQMCCERGLYSYLRRGASLYMEVYRHG